MAMTLSGCITAAQDYFGFKSSGQIQEELERDGRSTLVINFHTDSARITDDARRQVDEVASALTRLDLTGKKVLVVGHTDSRGTESYNQALSLDRAFAVMQSLTERKVIAVDQIMWDGKGESDPLVSPETTDQDRARNRRVEIRLVDAS